LLVQSDANPEGGSASDPEAAADAATESRTDDIPEKAGSPRAVLSRFVATNSCSAGERLDQSTGRLIGARPSAERAWSIASNVACSHPDDVSIVDPGQEAKKFGTGAMFEAGLFGGSRLDDDAVNCCEDTELRDTIETSPDDLPAPACTPGDDGDATMSATAASGTVNRAARPNGLWLCGRDEASAANLSRGYLAMVTDCLHRA
jgi:hypothetical protein